MEGKMEELKKIDFCKKMVKFLKNNKVWSFRTEIEYEGKIYKAYCGVEDITSSYKDELSEAKKRIIELEKKLEKCV